MTTGLSGGHKMIVIQLLVNRYKEFFHVRKERKAL